MLSCLSIRAIARASDATLNRPTFQFALCQRLLNPVELGRCEEEDVEIAEDAETFLTKIAQVPGACTLQDHRSSSVCP